MTVGHSRTIPVLVRFCLVAVLFVTQAVMPGLSHAQEAAPSSADRGVVEGHVLDPMGKPVANAKVSISAPDGAQRPSKQPETTQTDSAGMYRFSSLLSGTYVVVTDLEGYGSANTGSISLSQGETKTLDLVLVNPLIHAPVHPKESAAKTSTGQAVKDPHDPQAPDFYDEPQFTVAGVTQATDSAGHGADTIARNMEALAKATVSLSTSNKESIADSQATASAITEQSLRDALAANTKSVEANRKLGLFLLDQDKIAEALPFLQRASQLNPEDSESHRLLAEVEEKLGHPLEAAREYQRAGELQPSETNLFDWGTDLLKHRALEPATEVFVRGNHLYPKSARILIGLGVTWYARGSPEKAAQFFSAASDSDPANPTPYLFLGRMQGTEIVAPEISVARLGRFARLQPDNALANYYYAVSLWKQLATKDSGDADRTSDRRVDGSAQVEALLQKAVQLDPKLGPAYLQLGILYSERGDLSRAIPAYEKAIEFSPKFDPSRAQAHYRLAQAYLRTGDKVKGKEELELQARAKRQEQEHGQLERHEIQEFVITLGKHTSEAPTQP